MREITRTINYHSEVGVAARSLAVPWCASFVNYCLIKSVPRYSKSNQPGLAVSFSRDPHFKRIDTPVFGAIAVYTRTGGGHVCFVYALSETVNGNIIVLGGNQDDKINFVDRSTRRLVGYFVPVQYEAQALREIASVPLHKKTAAEMNASLSIDNVNNGRES
ncbi:TIGR02594 family protein [Serratia oryzae]|uniref:TIGR02594 family protein n=1 Tax=Serratia oryzae TaxID=2034155 RepID=UPI00097802EE|nr:TIGR02594 family protein [Serratia oryzae]